MRETHRLPSYSYGGHEVYNKVPEFVKPYGSKVAIIGGEIALSKALPVLQPVLHAADMEITDTILFGGECTYERGQEIANMATVQEADVLFAVGGGKAIDTVKLVAKASNDKPFFSFPTIAATCAATSEVAAVYTADHVFHDVCYIFHPPLHCFIDANILVEAPARYLWAGMGDTIAKRYESWFSARNRDHSYNAEMGLTLAKLCAEPVYEYAVKAYEDNKEGKRTDAFDQMAMAVIFTTGVVSSSLPEDFNSSLAHSICYGLTTNPETEENHLHGEMVAYGVLVLMMLDRQDEELRRWLPVYKTLGWPRKLAHLHLTTDYIPTIINKVMSVPDIEISPYPIVAEAVEEAIWNLERLDD